MYIIEHGRDKYQRLLGEVILPSGDTLNKLLLKEGLAWHYKYFDKSKDYAELEEQARKEKRGLWVMPEPMAPWEFRSSNGDPRKSQSFRE